MKISELENELNITRANIRFYEKEGLLKPDRKNNRYREYSESDLAILKKIIIYRKLGISINDIRKVLNNEIDLQDAVSQSIIGLQNEVEKLNGSIELCKRIKNSNETNETFNESYYWNEINNSEMKGNKFVGIIRDYSLFEKDIFYSFTKFHFLGIDLNKIEKKHNLIWVVFIFVLICVCRGIAGVYIWKYDSFFDGFLAPFLIFTVVSVLVFPIFIFREKHPKIARVWSAIVFCTAVIILLGAAILLIYAAVKAIFRF